MICVKFDICEEVVYLNTATCRFVTDSVKGVQIVPTGISKSEEGKDVLDGYTVLYHLKGGGIVSETELFHSEEECREHFLAALAPRAVVN